MRSALYADLTGIGFPAVKLENLEFGTLVMNLLQNALSGEEAEGEGEGTPSPAAPSNAPSNNPSNSTLSSPSNGANEVGNINGQSSSGVSGNSTTSTPSNSGGEGMAVNSESQRAPPVVDEFSRIKKVDISNFGWDSRLILATIGNDEFTVAATGAIIVALLSAISANPKIHAILGQQDFLFSSFRNIRIGYDPSDDLRGISIRVTDDTPYEQALKFGLHVKPGYSIFTNDREPGFDHTAYDENGVEVMYDDISAIGQIGLGLSVEVRLRTKPNVKSPQVEALEHLVESLINMPEGSFDFTPQNSLIIYGLELKVFGDLANLEETTISLEITYAREDVIIGIYYLGKDNMVYANLAGLGLFQAAISGIDLLSILNNFLGEFLEQGVGLPLGQMLNDVFDDLENADIGSILPDEEAIPEEIIPEEPPIEEEEEGEAPSSGGAAGYDESAALRILISNQELIINPNFGVLDLLLGGTLGAPMPKFADIRIIWNAYQGINNLALSLKLDKIGNYLEVVIPERGLDLKIGTKAETFKVKNIPGGKAKYGGLPGISLGLDSAGSLAVGADLTAIVSTLIDVIVFKDFKIFLEKRNDYYFLRNLKYGGVGKIMFTPFELDASTGPTYYSVAKKADDPGYTHTFKDSYDNAFAAPGSIFGGDSSTDEGFYVFLRWLADRGVLNSV